MKKENATTTTATIYTPADLQALAHEVDKVKASVESVTAKEYLDACAALSDALNVYNCATMEQAFSECSTLADVIKRAHFSSIYAKFDKKTGATSLVGRSTRFPLGAFLDYHKEAKHDISGAVAFADAVGVLVKSLRAFVGSEVTFVEGTKSGKAVKISIVCDALKAVMDAVGIEGVYARPKDVRFLSYAVTGGSASIGALREINRADVEKYLIDVYSVQLNKQAYGFEKKDSKEGK